MNQFRNFEYCRHLLGQHWKLIGTTHCSYPPHTITLVDWNTCFLFWFSPRLRSLWSIHYDLFITRV